MENKFIVYCKNSEDLDKEDLEAIKDLVNKDYDDAYFEVLAEYYLTTETYYKDDVEIYNKRLNTLKALKVDLDEMKNIFKHLDLIKL